MNEMVPVADIERMAAAFAASKLFGAKTKEEAMSLMLIAQAEGMHPAAAARDYHIIQGKASKKAEAMLRDFLIAGGKVEWHKLDDTAADATFSHQQGGTVRINWDMARVNNAKIANPDMYKKYPRQMLRSRCVSEGVRTVCPLATGGLYAPEEVPEVVQREKEIQGEIVKLDESVRADFQSAIETEIDPDKLADLWLDIAKACRAADDLDAYNDLKAKVAAKGELLKKAA